MAFQEQGVKVLRVLYVGSDAAAMRLASRQLERGGLRVAADLARTPEEFAIQLDNVAYDLVLAEFELPGWPGGSAQQIWRQQANSIPLILVVSTANEEEAFQCVKRGATDYVLKTNLERLPLAVWKMSREREHLIRTKEAGKTANLAKREFLSNMGHELRTPLSEIIGVTELALETELTPEQREYFVQIKRSADVLQATIHNILEFSSIETRELGLEEIRFDLYDNLAQAAQRLAPAAHQKGLELLLDIRPAVPRFLRGDLAQLLQILFHLIGNAVKFTERGEILLQADLESENEEGVVLHFLVLDTGIGIQGEQQQVIFEAFSQADGSLTRKFCGTGLGLTIAARLVSIMGGRIWVESEPGRGSAFHFTAPFKRVREGRADL